MFSERGNMQIGLGTVGLFASVQLEIGMQIRILELVWFIVLVAHHVLATIGHRTEDAVALLAVNRIDEQTAVRGFA